MSRIDTDRDCFQSTVELLADHPDLDADPHRSLQEATTGRRWRAELIRPRSWSEITAAVEAGWASKKEAQKEGSAARPKWRARNGKKPRT